LIDVLKGLCGMQVCLIGVECNQVEQGSFRFSILEDIFGLLFEIGISFGVGLG
jgi:hypothetical protein